MDEQKTQIVDKLKEATNILVTVSSSPSVDQLSAAIGLTIFLNKVGKHASAVYSGSTPAAIQFLEPQRTLEKTTDSLRDFIIALDKAKADKLRYKVEDQQVKIFITPYQTSITDKDLEFSHGDFNVEVVLALGVREQGELDQAITAHGSILHDAAVFGIGAGDPPVALGNANWNDPKASSLSEMAASLCITLKPDDLDSQMATALLTGIVAETERFSNEKTSSETMQVSAKLMHAGADQKLVASQMQQPVMASPSGGGELPEPEQASEDAVDNDGSLHIAHSAAAPAEEPKPDTGEIHIDEDGTFKTSDELVTKLQHEKVIKPPSEAAVTPGMILEPPKLDIPKTPVLPGADAQPTSAAPAAANSPAVPILSHGTAKNTKADTTAPAADPEDTVIVQPTNAQPTVVLPPAPAKNEPVAPLDSLANLEKKVDSPHVDEKAQLDAAREAVNQIVNAAPVVSPAPVAAAPQIIMPSPQPAAPVTPPAPAVPASEENDPRLPPGFTSLITPDKPADPVVSPSPAAPTPSTAPAANPAAPPPVPPPMMPPPMPPTNPPTPGSPTSTAL